MKILIYLLLLLQLSGCIIVPQVPKDEIPDKKIETPEEPEEAEVSEKDLFYEYEEEAKHLLQKMSIEEKIGQMFLVRCPEDEKLDMYLTMNPGGFIMFGRDFAGKTKEEVIGNIDYFQKNSLIPMIVGVDEEGGTVVRVSSNPNLAEEPFKSPQELFNLGGYEEIRRDTEEKSKLLKSLGINLNLSPVADISTDPYDFIFDRSFGKPAEETAQFVKVVVETAKENKISSALKHFPGYGNNADTHTSSAYDKRPYEEFLNRDFIPFKEGIEANAECVLVSHNIVESIDPEFPASLSKKAIDILKNDLNFTGIVMTDDLSMGAISEFSTIYPPEVMAVMAGNDMLIVTDFETGYNSLLSAVKEEIIPEERINESVLKILKWKFYLELFT
ncbi:MAG TPA: beta-hexosaminidase [Tissierellia bacterium]|nr:beta-hexosaminidase [Tissierellia bacterium]